MLIRCRGRIERMNQAEEAASWIISRAKPEDLIIHYNTPAFLHDDPSSFLTGLARVTGQLKNNDRPNIIGSAQSLLRDWRVGNFTYYTLPPKPPSPEISKSGPKPYENLLSPFLSRKELEKRNGGLGLIRLLPENPEERPVNLEFVQTFEARKPQPEAARVAKSLASAEESEEAESSEEAAGEDESDEDSEIAPILSSKRKRIVSRMKGIPPTKSKKVSFAPTNRDKTKHKTTVSFDVKPSKNKLRTLSSTPNAQKRTTPQGEEYDFQQFIASV